MVNTLVGLYVDDWAVSRGGQDALHLFSHFKILATDGMKATPVKEVSHQERCRFFIGSALLLRGADCRPVEFRKRRQFWRQVLVSNGVRWSWEP
jgi:hypothetical protein